jgi:hypothetical protein
VLADVWVEPPSERGVGQLADWAELTLFLSGEDGITADELERRLADEPEAETEAGVATGTDELDDRELRRAGASDRVQPLLAEVQRRQGLAPAVYPYRVEEQLLVRDSAIPGARFYDALLVLSRPEAPFRGRDGKKTIPRDVEETFDRLAQHALRRVFPPETRSVLFDRGYARDPADDETRPTSFPKAIAWLRALLNADGLELPHSEVVEDDPDAEHVPAGTYNDGGVDIIVWQPFADAGPGFEVLLAQCTVQREWRRKTRDVSLTLWRSWINFPGPVRKGLAIPFAVDQDRWWWRDRNRLAGTIFDRMRLCGLIEQYGADGIRTLAEEAWLAVWIGDQEAAMSAAAARN